MCNHAAKPSALSTPNISRPDIAVGEAFDPQTRNANSIMSTLYCVYNKIKNSFIYYFQQPRDNNIQAWNSWKTSLTLWGETLLKLVCDLYRRMMSVIQVWSF